MSTFLAWLAGFERASVVGDGAGLFTAFAAGLNLPVATSCPLLHDASNPSARAATPTRVTRCCQEVRTARIVTPLIRLPYTYTTL
ncbi:hypothetical protein GCM10009539_45240 [Cryptosporangium japonicum]|uniref:Uncharacterized protein n=1 Tax=Cryptosporangium japonicum TaxID=80872 RepID=A0ABP3E7M6_9ACTN